MQSSSSHSSRSFVVSSLPEESIPSRPEIVVKELPNFSPRLNPDSVAFVKFTYDCAVETNAEQARVKNARNIFSFRINVGRNQKFISSKISLPVVVGFVVRNPSSSFKNETVPA